MLHDLGIGLLLFLMLAHHLTFLLFVFNVVVEEIHVQSGLQAYTLFFDFFELVALREEVDAGEVEVFG